MKSICCLRMFCIVVALFCNSQIIAAENSTELEARKTLRVCSDPNNLPYSNRATEGFENKIAELIAAKLGVSLSYYWFPQSTGFVRTTLGTRRCDLIIGISGSNELLLNTNPYYSSAFALIYPVVAGYKLTSLSAPGLKDKNLRIGLVAGTPPTGLLLETGLMEQVASYHLIVDTRVDAPAEQIVKDMLAGKLDVAVLWGPIAGYMNKKYGEQFKIVPLVVDHSDKYRMIYSITMGVRFGEIEWKRQLNRILRRNEEEIHAILSEYDIPLVEAR